ERDRTRRRLDGRLRIRLAGIALPALATQRLEQVGRVGHALRLGFGHGRVLLERLLVEGRRILLIFDGVEGAQAGDQAFLYLALARELRGIVVLGRESAAARVVCPARIASHSGCLEGELDDPALLGLPAGPALS